MMDEFKEEIVEMATILMEMDTDTYLRCKYMILSDAALRCKPGTVKFLNELFTVTDRKRPLLLDILST